MRFCQNKYAFDSRCLYVVRRDFPALQADRISYVMPPDKVDLQHIVDKREKNDWHGLHHLSYQGSPDTEATGDIALAITADTLNDSAG